jgi:aminoglycoside/choline kinase family phosphotransferase
MHHDRITRLFRQHFGTPPVSILEIAADGSNRGYFRVIGPNLETAVGAIGPDAEENRAFFSFTRAFRSINLPVPEIYGTDAEAGVWLEEDLGDTTLFAALSAARNTNPGTFPESMVAAYRSVVELLPRFQVEGGRTVDYADAYPRPAFDKQSIIWDLNYFKYHFLKLAHVPFNEQRLENDFTRLADFLLLADTQHFLYRDFQSRNIMLRDGEPWFIDYQGGRRGAPQYDIASLLYDAKAALPDSLRSELLAHYADTLRKYIEFDRGEFYEHYRGYVLVRIMQAMGAYGYRGFFERKSRFLESVPLAAGNINRILEQGLPIRLPELETVFRRIVDRFAQTTSPEPSRGLTIYINSFSYRRGYPEDTRGHGGGFVFDCRAVPNPGRHLEYSNLVGTDADVIEYIEKAPESESFWRSISALVNNQVKEYLRRGFTSLSVSFGCTGGQHRSVYMAERLALHMRKEFPAVAVELLHRERPYWPAREENGASPRADAAAARGLVSRG